MSCSLVRTCGRCGRRAEIEIRSLEGAERASLVLRLSFAQLGADDGCPLCDPELARRCKAIGIDPDRYQAAVNRARGRGPA
jgi:hypothetical protein